jgi:two-component system cell cycle response regulator
MKTVKEVKKNPIEILIVEDSVTQAIELQKLLEENAYKVSVAPNGLKALSLLKNYKPTLVISDIIMPDMNGYELCRQVKNDDRLKNIPVILMTTLSEPEDIIRGLECGADNFIIKPINRKVFLSRVKYILVNKKIRREGLSGLSLEVFFSGKKHLINAERLQIIDLLFSTYENTVQKSDELRQIKRELQKANETIKVLQGIIPTCANCRKIRNEKGQWQHMEAYISQNSEAEFSHGLCPECVAKLYPDFYEKKLKGTL